MCARLAQPCLMTGAGAGKLDCEHNRVRRECAECRDSDSDQNDSMKAASAFCEHYRDRKLCKICRGGALCEHNRERRRCIDCGGPGICEHRRIKRQVQGLGFGVQGSEFRVWGFRVCGLGFRDFRV